MKGIEKKIIHSIFLQLAMHTHTHEEHERYDDRYNGIIALKTSIVSLRHAFQEMYIIHFFLK